MSKRQHWSNNQTKTFHIISSSLFFSHHVNLTNNLTFFLLRTNELIYFRSLPKLNTNLSIIISNNYIPRAAVIPIKTTEVRKQSIALFFAPDVEGEAEGVNVVLGSGDGAIDTLGR
mmetsp:Transcript_13843/g.15204  ORF Transcript_13843/g.15204 Transcript_13843/m.15204 type:complete len:116 (+) Transcript_13843:655-1002(+)